MRCSRACLRQGCTALIADRIADKTICVMCAVFRRKHVYKAPKAEERHLKAPQPGSLSSLSYPEFGYVLRARQAAQCAQQAASRPQAADAWTGSADGLEDEHLHNAETFGGDWPQPQKHAQQQ